MANERWNSPFPWSIPYHLFQKHFTELNEIYWAHVPAANTIEKTTLAALGSSKEDPKKFFLVRDDDDHRVASTYDQWKTNYREFLNYTRLNMLMLLSSCFETYLRTVVALSLESKPGCIIGCPKAIDGLFLLKTRPGYGDVDNSNYQFSDIIESICKGTWQTRASNFTKYFSGFPIASADIVELDQLRQSRNHVGHYFGRTKQRYEAPLSLSPDPAQRLSHERLIKFFALVYRTVKSIDKYLQSNFIGSYDICKYYYQCVQSGQISGSTVGQQAANFQKLMGETGLPPVGKEFYRNLLAYISLSDKDEECRYGKKACIIAINRKLSENGVSFETDSHSIRFRESHFNLFCKAYSLRSNSEYCMRQSKKQLEFFYSMKTIDFIVSKICENPSGIMDEVKLRIEQKNGIN